MSTAASRVRSPFAGRTLIMISAHVRRGSRRRQAVNRHHSTLEAICRENRISYNLNALLPSVQRDWKIDRKGKDRRSLEWSIPGRGVEGIQPAALDLLDRLAMIRIQDCLERLFSGAVLGAWRKQRESTEARCDTGPGDFLSGCNANMEKT